jgi:hypothetical protein
MHCRLRVRRVAIARRPHFGAGSIIVETGLIAVDFRINPRAFRLNLLAAGPLQSRLAAKIACAHY